jgi:hypothetical protein
LQVQEQPGLPCDFQAGLNYIKTLSQKII